MDPIKNPTLREVRHSPAMLSKLCVKLVSIKDLIGLNNKMICCPFHKDDTPSAKFHSDPDGDRLWCYGCQKMYTSYHYIRSVLEKDVYAYLNEKFGPKVLEFECQNLDFVDDKRKELDLNPVISLWKGAKDLSETLDKLYELTPDPV